MSFSRHQKSRLLTKTIKHPICLRRMQITTVSLVKFLSKYSSVISVSQATLRPRTFSNPRNGKSALLLFWAKFAVRLGCCWHKILWNILIVSETHVAVSSLAYSELSPPPPLSKVAANKTARKHDVIPPFTSHLLLEEVNPSPPWLPWKKWRFLTLRDGPLEKWWGGGEGNFLGCRNFFFCSLLVHEFFFQVKPSARIFFFQTNIAFFSVKSWLIIYFSAL